IPTAFTPDFDEHNQLFEPIFAAGFNPDDYNFKVFNRYGEILFESNDHKVGWDGTYNGKMSEEGTYVYKIEFGIEKSPEREVVTGHFTLLK
ncbi:T9SS type B sorting domain-containing protein, partial [Brumimicrobium mesophilum]|uniref:T9SS type B sorting domain-containing protein n=1 Tax=Brumimicrobium mesophilum TaxID=392717 RepID=UPI00131B07CF